MSNADVRKLKEKRNTPEGNLDTNGNPLRFSRDRESDWTIKNDTPHYGLKEHTSVDVQSGFVLATTLTTASEHDSKYLPYLTIASCHTKDPIETVYGDKGYYGHPNRAFLHMNGIKDGIMRKDTTTAKLTELGIERNKSISKKRYIRFQPVGLTGRRVEQYFGLSHLHDGRRPPARRSLRPGGLVEASGSERAYRARFTTILKNIWDTMCRQMAFNMFRGSKLLAHA